MRGDEDGELERVEEGKVLRDTPSSRSPIGPQVSDSRKGGGQG